MSITCPYCGAVAGYGNEIGHKSYCASLDNAPSEVYAGKEVTSPVIICLSLPPSTNALFSGYPRRHISDEYKSWREVAGWELAQQRPRKCLGKVSLTFEVREPPTKRDEDISNRLKAAEDLLVAHGIIEGDSQHFVRRIVLEWSDQVEGIRITINAWEE